MSSLAPIDRLKLEKFLGMEWGYVCNFTDRSFGEFVLETTGMDIYSPQYASGGTSKAKRLRTFWNKEQDNIVGVLMKAMIEYRKNEILLGPTGRLGLDEDLHVSCLNIISKLENKTSVEGAEVFTRESKGGLSILAKQIQESIKANEPNLALDRLHTFIVKKIRLLCDKHDIAYRKDTALHALFGCYVKFLRECGHIESSMSERILMSSIKIFEELNKVRNDQSLAHDNKLLNHNESVLIFNTIIHILGFIDLIEGQIVTNDQERNMSEDTDEEVDAYIANYVDQLLGK